MHLSVKLLNLLIPFFLILLTNYAMLGFSNVGNYYLQIETNRKAIGHLWPTCGISLWYLRQGEVRNRALPNLKFICGSSTVPAKRPWTSVHMKLKKMVKVCSAGCLFVVVMNRMTDSSWKRLISNYLWLLQYWLNTDFRGFCIVELIYEIEFYWSAISNNILINDWIIGQKVTYRWNWFSLNPQKLLTLQEYKWNLSSF